MGATRSVGDDEHALAAHAFSRALGERLVRVADELTALIAQAARAEGLTPLEARALRYIVEGVSQRDLSALLAVDAPRVTNLLNSLQRRELVYREVSWGDRRVRIVRATEAGRAASERVGRVLIARSPIVHRLSEPQRRQLFELLGRLEGQD